METIKIGFSPNMLKPYVLLLPMGGMGLFMVLYVLAALFTQNVRGLFRDKTDLDFGTIICAISLIMLRLMEN